MQSKAIYIFLNFPGGACPGSPGQLHFHCPCALPSPSPTYTHTQILATHLLCDFLSFYIDNLFWIYNLQAAGYFYTGKLNKKRKHAWRASSDWQKLIIMVTTIPELEAKCQCLQIFWKEVTEKESPPKVFGLKLFNLIQSGFHSFETIKTWSVFNFLYWPNNLEQA